MEEVVEVPVMDDEYPATFTGEFVPSTGRAVALVEQLVRDGDTESLGDWYEL